VSRRTRALIIAAAVSAPVFLVAAPAANATCIPGHVTVYPKPEVQLPRCDQPPQ
jgi:hypothetical protein